MPAFLAVLVFLVGLPALPAAAAERDASGIFLVAKREMRDPRFRESVVLVTLPGEGGPVGVIINKPLEHRLAEVFPGHAKLKDRKDVLYFGGPVAPEGLVVLLRAEQAPPNALRVLKDVYFVTDRDAVERLLEREDPMQGLRVYAGYAGWAPGQLQNELARGDWHVAPADAGTVFEKPSRGIWPELEQRATTKHTNSRESERARPPVF
jgi:putative transcriptional regulator